MASFSPWHFHFPFVRGARSTTILLALGTVSLAALGRTTEPPVTSLHRAPPISPVIDGEYFDDT